MAFAMLMSIEVRGNEAPLPDLTKGTDGIDRSLTYNLGATGMRGWIYTPHWAQNIAYLDAMQGRTTGSSRQILVTQVGEDLGRSLRSAAERDRHVAGDQRSRHAGDR